MATITTHVLNAVDGSHAGGIPVRLVHLTTGREMFATQTDPGGRLSQEVDLSNCAPDDRFELTLTTSPYWQQQGCGDIMIQIMTEVVLRFTMPDPDARYHMPVVLSPNSYTTWWSAPE